MKRKARALNLLVGQPTKDGDDLRVKLAELQFRFNNGNAPDLFLVFLSILVLQRYEGWAFVPFPFFPFVICCTFTLFLASVLHLFPLRAQFGTFAYKVKNRKKKWHFRAFQVLNCPKTSFSVEFEGFRSLFWIINFFTFFTFLPYIALYRQDRKSVV